MPSLKSVCLLSVCCFSVLRMQLLCAAEYSMWCLIFTTWCQYTFFFILLTCHIYSCFTNSFPTFPRIPTTSRENAWTCSEKHRWLMFCISKDQPESPMSSAVNQFLKQRPESPHFYWKYFLSSKLLGSVFSYFTRLSVFAFKMITVLLRNRNQVCRYNLSVNLQFSINQKKKQNKKNTNSQQAIHSSSWFGTFYAWLVKLLVIKLVALKFDTFLRVIKSFLLFFSGCWHSSLIMSAMTSP